MSFIDYFILFGFSPLLGVFRLSRYEMEIRWCLKTGYFKFVQIGTGLICPALIWSKKIGIFIPKLFWPTVKKNCSGDRENFWNSRLKAKNLQNFWDHLYNLFKLWKVRTVSGNIMFFFTYSWRNLEIFLFLYCLIQVCSRLNKHLMVKVNTWSYPPSHLLMRK